MNDLIRRCLSLDRKNKEYMVSLLQQSLVQKEQDKERFLALFSIATDLFGNGILTRVKDYECVLGRRFIAYQMKEEGYSYSASSIILHICITLA